MGIGNGEPVEHALDRAILAEAAVQRVEHGVGARGEGGDDGGDVLADLDRGHLEAGFAQCRDHLQAGRQADLAFGGNPAVEDRDTGHGGHGKLLPLPLREGVGGRGSALPPPASRSSARHTDAMDLPLQRDTGRRMDAAPHFLAKTLEVSRGRVCRC